MDGMVHMEYISLIDHMVRRSKSASRSWTVSFCVLDEIEILFGNFLRASLGCFMVDA